MIPSVATQAQTESSRFLTFRVGPQLYALNCEQVLEVIRVPALARVPQGPAALLGIANLRGAILPLAGLHELLGRSAATRASAAARAIVLDVGSPVALVVDSVASLESVSAEQIDTRPNEIGADGSERLLGVFSVGPDKQAAKILDIKALLESAFSTRSPAQPREHKLRAAARAEIETGRPEQTENLVTFEVAGQEFAFTLADVQEILPAPATVTAVARSDAVVLGLTSVRDALLPLLSLRALLGFTAKQAADDREKVVVVKVGGTRVGLVADRARAIVAADSKLVEAVPPALAARAGGESRIRAVYRAEAGRHLISILSPQQLFREDVMQRLAASRSGQSSHDSPHAAAVTGNELIFLVFRLGNDEFGLPIDAVVEVAQVPDQITRVPKTPKFLEGVVNLRGDILPVVDQRRRFDMPDREKSAGRRLIVVKTERHRAGLIVDSVSDVLRAYAHDVQPPPELSDEISRLLRGVINLEAVGRIVLLLDPTELLTRAEQGLLDKFNAERQRAGA